MKNLTTLLLPFFLLILTQHSYAIEECPAVSQIIPIGLNAATVSDWDWTTTYAPNYEYKPKQKWNFFITGHDQAHLPRSNNEALQWGLRALPSLKYATRVQVKDKTICSYRTNDRFITASASYPAINLS